MTDTSLSLLDRVRHQDGEAWGVLVEIYSPLIRGWLRRQGVREHDADDVVQEALAVVYRKVGDFDRQPQTGSFRSWLRQITVNCLRNYLRSPRGRALATGGSEFQQMLDQLADGGSDLSKLWDREHDRHVAEQLLERVRPHFTDSTWQAFKALAIEGVKAEEVAARLNMSVGAVFVAKSRVLARVREIGQDLVDLG